MAKTLHYKLQSISMVPEIRKDSDADKNEWQFLANLVFGKANKYKYAHMMGVMVASDIMYSAAEGLEKKVITKLRKRYGPEGIRLGSDVTYFIEEFYINEKLGKQNKELQLKFKLELKG